MILKKVSTWRDGQKVSTHHVSINRWNWKGSGGLSERLQSTRIKLMSPEWKWKWKLFTLVPQNQESDRDCCDTREFRIGDVEKSSGLSYTLQMNNPAASQNPSALKQANVWGESRRGQLEAGVAFFYWLHHTESRRQRGVRLCLVRLGDCTHRWFLSALWCLSESVTWFSVCGSVFSCSRIAPSRCMYEGADSFNFPELSPWSEGHIPGRGRFAHCLFSSPSLLLLYTRSASFFSAPASPLATIDILTDLCLWKINKTTLWVLLTLILYELELPF